MTRTATILMALALVAATPAVTLDQFIRNVARYLDMSEPPPNHPRRNKHMHERLTALRMIVQQMDMDIEAGSSPITIRQDAVEIAGHAYFLSEFYAATFEAKR